MRRSSSRGYWLASTDCDLVILLYVSFCYECGLVFIEVLHTQNQGKGRSSGVWDIVFSGVGFGYQSRVAEDVAGNEDKIPKTVCI